MALLPTSLGAGVSSGFPGDAAVAGQVQLGQDPLDQDPLDQDPLDQDPLDQETGTIKTMARHISSADPSPQVMYCGGRSRV